MYSKSGKGRSVSSKKTDSEYKTLSENIQKASKVIGTSKEKSRAFLIRAGICNKDGSLKKVYR
jgi:hypothetical protein